MKRFSERIESTRRIEIHHEDQWPFFAEIKEIDEEESACKSSVLKIGKSGGIISLSLNEAKLLLNAINQLLHEK